jgi:hypothetical protein
LERIKKEILFFILSGIIFITPACGIGLTDPDETIIVQNRSGKNGVEVYIDGSFKGMVDNGRDLEIIGDYDGAREFYARVDIYNWGPSYYNIEDGGDFTWVLN